MKSQNKVQLIGYLGIDPVITTLHDGRLVARLRMATDTYIRQKDGPPKKITAWHTIKVWGQEQVKSLQNYLLKGSHLLVDGRVVYRTYEDKAGHTRYVTEISATYLVDLDR